MAEFIDVIHTIQRICKQNNGQCFVCMLGKFACPNNARFDKTEEAAFREFENTVVKWAAEHPEPVYPTWAEWLYSQGLMTDVIDGKGGNFLYNLASEPIPADLAQKLGLEPKEG